MTLRCPTCGTSFADTARFCTRDGTRLPRPAAASPAPAPPPPAAGAPAPTAVLGGLSGQVLDGRYHIDSKIGEGGMSFVYQATDQETGRRCAIKVLSPALSADAKSMARLRREAEVGGRLAHPNVCHILRLGQTPNGIVYIVMPYVEGEILADRTFRLGHVPLTDVIAYMTQMAAGLEEAHALGIVHRDLKPENVMICRGEDGAEYAVVMDFGLAKERRAGAELEKLTATGIVLGTPEFMSPEQLRGKPLDGRSDVYALALMTFEMLTGRLPFEGTSQQELMIARLRADPMPLRRARPELKYPAAVEKVILKGLAREPDQRYRSASEFASALAAAPTAAAPARLFKLFGGGEGDAS